MNKLPARRMYCSLAAQQSQSLWSGLLFAVMMLCLPTAANATDWEYRWPGLHYTSESFSANLRLRAQLRGTSNKPYGPGFGEEDELRSSSINRARIKLGGHLYRPDVVYYSEYDLPSQRLLDLRVTLGTSDAPLQVRLGQWKVPFNRERIDSSGNQQFVDRSLSNRFFTLDRQRGAMVSGRILQGSRLDSTYSLAALEGAGRNADGQSAGIMWLGRWDWHLLGEVLAFSQSDIKLRSTPAATLTFATTRYRGPYTEFSSSGGGQLPGFSEGGVDRYSISQLVQESAWQWRGLSWQQELHSKVIDDTEQQRTHRLAGGYAQAGWLPHSFFKALPEQFEVALRYSAVDPDRSVANNTQQEISIGMNWFFSGHNNKLSLDYTHGEDNKLDSQYRAVRVQWDFHL